jgi:hypothetical protein
LIVDWPTRARDAVARFRADYGCHAGDSHFVELIERLNLVSPEFAQWWPRHDILPLTEGCLQDRHPLVGRILAEHMTFSVADNPEVRLVVFVPATEANSISKMRKVIGASHNGARPQPARRRTDCGAISSTGMPRIRMDIISQ